MEAEKILFIAQEINPYVPESNLTRMGRDIPLDALERNREIRAFMPKWGNINERRNQLHEVIRLSGMNIIVNDNDHQLIIKVASIMGTRMQVYFIDNEDYFAKRLAEQDKEGKRFEGSYVDDLRDGRFVIHIGKRRVLTQRKLRVDQQTAERIERRRQPVVRFLLGKVCHIEAIVYVRKRRGASKAPVCVKPIFEQTLRRFAGDLAALDAVQQLARAGNRQIEIGDVRRQFRKGERRMRMLRRFRLLVRNADAGRRDGGLLTAE